MPHWTDKYTTHRESPIEQSLIRENDHYVIKSSQNTQAILDDIQRKKSQGQRHGTQGSIAASVPEILYWVEWPNEFRKIYGFHPKRPPPNIKSKDSEKMWRDFFIMKLHDRDYSKLRIDERKFTANG